jgi:hypothetical protein
MMGMKSVPEILESFKALMQLSAKEDFIQFCHCESLKTYKMNGTPHDKKLGSS